MLCLVTWLSLVLHRLTFHVKGGGFSTSRDLGLMTRADVHFLAPALVSYRPAA